MTQSPDSYFYLGELKVLPSRNTIILGDKQMVLQPKVMAVLDYLASHQDRVVSGDELLAELWKGRIVTPGSVQKSINSLRKALNELCGDQEMIVHYSKRGYQLVIPPVFSEDTKKSEDTNKDANVQVAGIKQLANDETLKTKNRFYWFPVFGLSLLLILSAAWFFWPKASKDETLPLARNHMTSFESFKEFINNQSREGLPKPHPDNKHLAYVRQVMHATDDWEIDSQLMIKNPQGDDWQIAMSQGSWDFLAWSPDGRYLVAVERWREDGQSLTPDFYESDAFLYTFHIFALDLANNRLLEKYLLSQWQGRINSLTWWDKETLEFVATQGLAVKPERYRYSVIEQQLAEIETNTKARPLFSQVKDQRTALVMQEKQELRIDLLDEKQQIRGSWQLDDPNVEVNWLPDSSGVLVHQPVQQKLYILYWDGEKLDLDIKRPAYQSLINPVYQPDGKGIYYTLENRRQEIEWWRNGETSQSLYTNSDMAAFSPDGQQLVYAAEQGGTWNLWLQTVAGELRQLPSNPMTQKPSHLVWAADGHSLVYKIGRQIWFYSINDNKSNHLGLESSFSEPLAYESKDNMLLIIKISGEARNVWSVDTHTLEQKQLTFGAVGALQVDNTKVYFQYRGKPGLWVLDIKDSKPQLVSQHLDANSRLLLVDTSGIYFVTGGYCRESSIQYLNFIDDSKKVYWARKNAAVITRDFHPQSGLLQTTCRLAPSHILLAQ